ncbi:hypothetical protein Tsubulata_015493 [Turnera subulata]|uniref:BHLH domain-containing protein n=1 Tax=Turnera subulata TaxID=218843 RepID=A0A9Q0JBI9_9ROSI|nr:hypothetical protein Tsubulata_015493 [Turnera subulata]
MANLETVPVPENLRKQLALAVTSIQWSYAIFWSLSSEQPGLLEWGDGYYNGDIKTRKTVQSIELNADQLGLQRSEQLRELYLSLSAGEASQEARRPSAALSPEDLTDAEWYYLVCMSFVFDIGQGLPGRTLANGRPTWMCNAHNADSKVFSRSLLAKTVVSFPFSRGVVELGVTELVLEDPSLIQHIKASFLEIPCPILMNDSGARSDKELDYASYDQGNFANGISPIVECEGLDIASPNNSSDNLPDEDSILEGIHQGASQVQSWQFIDDDFSNCVRQSMNSSDCISQAIVDTVKVVPVPDEEKGNYSHCLQEVQDCTRKKFTALDLRSDDLHYQSVVSCLLKTSDPLILGACLHRCHLESSFMSWKKVNMVPVSNSKGRTPQNILKKILFDVPRMHLQCLFEVREDNIDKVGVLRPEADEIDHALSERNRREKINQRFMILKSIVPSTSKVDKVSILDDTIEYLKELERRVKELESCRELTELEESTKAKPLEAVERTSDNYGRRRVGSTGKGTSASKRKASEIYGQPAVDRNVSKDGSSVAVSMNDEQVLVEVKCPWREGVLLEIMDAASHLLLDSHSVQSSTIDGILSLNMTFKQKGPITASARTIKQALQRVASKC